MACWDLGRVFEVVLRVRKYAACFFRYTGTAFESMVGFLHLSILVATIVAAFVGDVV